MKLEKFNLITFNSTHEAIAAEKELQQSGIKMRIIPVPKEISAGCGISVKLNLEDLQEVRKILGEKNIETLAYYYIEKLGLKKKVVEVHL